MCKVLNVARSSYYRWYSGGISKRKLENIHLTEMIATVFEESKRTYGSPRISAELKRRGLIVSKPRVAKLMRLNGLKSKIRRKYRVTTN
ncbi:MAG: IS3 family transposase, partial [Flavobacteriaceae bacterium]|nr:IS3 family transposase [Flavobacteriaceae bacterium]